MMTKTNASGGKTNTFSPNLVWYILGGRYHFGKGWGGGDTILFWGKIYTPAIKNFI